ncbi:MAG: hypothetical protein HYZ84_06350 [Candidatus Omnitrophica bacterium]|nr:hypothetical protein [Candidatus Omnitrophota bacterium]
MEISHQVVKPVLQRLLQDYNQLHRDIRNHVSTSPDFLEFKIQVEDKLNQLKVMNMLGGFSCLHAGALTLEEQNRLRENLRNLKLGIRFLTRRWKRHLVSENRIRKQREKRIYVSTVAA